MRVVCGCCRCGVYRRGGVCCRGHCATLRALRILQSYIAREVVRVALKSRWGMRGSYAFDYVRLAQPPAACRYEISLLVVVHLVVNAPRGLPVQIEVGLAHQTELPLPLVLTTRRVAQVASGARGRDKEIRWISVYSADSKI